MNYLDLGGANLLRRNSVRLTRVEVTIAPSEEFDVVDNVPCRKELEVLGVAWRGCVVFGLLDILMLKEFAPLYKIRVTLDEAAYHDVDSSEKGDAGRKNEMLSK